MQRPATLSHNGTNTTAFAEGKNGVNIVSPSVVGPNCSRDERGQDNEEATSEARRIEIDERT